MATKRAYQLIPTWHNNIIKRRLRRVHCLTRCIHIHLACMCWLYWSNIDYKYTTFIRIQRLLSLERRLDILFAASMVLCDISIIMRHRERTQRGETMEYVLWCLFLELWLKCVHAHSETNLTSPGFQRNKRQCFIVVVCVHVWWCLTFILLSGQWSTCVEVPHQLHTMLSNSLHQTRVESKRTLNDRAQVTRKSSNESGIKKISYDGNSSFKVIAGNGSSSVHDSGSSNTNGIPLTMKPPHIRKEVPSDTDQKTTTRIDFGEHFPEGGWGWIVTAAATLVYILCNGFHYAFGTLYLCIVDSKDITVDDIHAGNYSYLYMHIKSVMSVKKRGGSNVKMTTFQFGNTCSTKTKWLKVNVESPPPPQKKKREM